MEGQEIMGTREREGEMNVHMGWKEVGQLLSWWGDVCGTLTVCVCVCVL